MYILKEIACKKDEIEANDRLLKFCVTFGTPGISYTDVFRCYCALPYLGIEKQTDVI